MRLKVSFVILKGARRNIPHDEPLGQSETKTITLRIHSIQVIPSGLLMSYRISLSEGVASVMSSRQRIGYYSFTTDLTDLLVEEIDQKVSVVLGGAPPWAFRHRSLLKTSLGSSPMPQLPVLPCRTF